MSPRPNTLHQRLLSLFIVQLEAFVRAHVGCRYLPEVDLVLSEKTVYCPDLCCYRPGRIKGYPTRLETPPDLVIEILSHGTKAFDLTTKRDDYAQFGVSEYWTYDPAGGRAPDPLGTLRCFRAGSFPGKDFLDQSPSPGAAHFESTSLPGFVLDVDALRSGTGD